MLDLEALRLLVTGSDFAPLFVTVSGAHLYGFPSPDSDVDLRGCHRLPLEAVVGLEVPELTVQRKIDHGGTEVELVSHDVGKYLRLLVKNNGYVLEQIFSPLVVMGDGFLEQLRPLARRCITRHHYHHYRGFLGTQRKLLEKQQPRRVKAVLYAYRVVLTGIHLLRTGEVEANLPRLADLYERPFLPRRIEQKRREKGTAPDLDWAFHDAQLTELEAVLDRAYQESPLPEDRDRRAVHQLLVDCRLRPESVLAAAPGPRYGQG
jgi:predicted nucleotidyltransferase